MMNTLTGMRVAVLVTDGFEQVEMTGPIQALERADASVQIVSDHTGEVRGCHGEQPADTFEVHFRFADADPMDFDAVLLPGGPKNGERIATIPEAQHFVQQMDELGKPIAAICHGPLLLASAGLLEGRTMTSWPEIESDMRQVGANWVDREVVVDGNLIT
ncbi:MAG TPA: type 1 glutamine amidotransferase domain-containing protein, partial [Noviherbaspirillum sp.]|nr:type 1 glutamine amidotransferase domain-containing protein [Noviherbaspirillum sp.]